MVERHTADRSGMVGVWAPQRTALKRQSCRPLGKTAGAWEYPPSRGKGGGGGEVGEGKAKRIERTSSSNLRSWIMLATDFCLMHLALSMYLRA